MDPGWASESSMQPVGEAFQVAAALDHHDVGARGWVSGQDSVGFQQFHEGGGVASGIGMADPGLATERLVELGRPEGHR